jgi:hypothetical protein
MGCGNSTVTCPPQFTSTTEELVVDSEPAERTDEAKSKDVTAASGAATVITSTSTPTPPSTAIPTSTSTTTCTSAARDLAGDTAASEPAKASDSYIRVASLRPARSAFLDEQPDWKWEKETDRWVSYSLSDSILLDQYWDVFASAQPNGPHLANITLNQNKV